MSRVLAPRGTSEARGDSESAKAGNLTIESASSRRNAVGRTEKSERSETTKVVSAAASDRVSVSDAASAYAYSQRDPSLNLLNPE